MALESLKRRFRVERLGDLTIDWIKVLVYLESTRRGDRESSAENLGRRLGVSENTITDYAYPALFRKGYIKILGENLPRRDANSYELTPKGKRALGKLLNAVGLFELGIMVGISLVVGALVGLMYLESPPGLPPPSLLLRSSFAFTPPRSGALAYVVRSWGVGCYGLVRRGEKRRKNCAVLAERS
jgi:hypothetical protein